MSEDEPPKYSDEEILKMMEARGLPRSPVNKFTRKLLLRRINSIDKPLSPLSLNKNDSESNQQSSEINSQNQEDDSGQDSSGQPMESNSSDSIQEVENDSSSTYIGISSPTSVRNIQPCVLRNLQDTKKILKDSPGSRFKCFNTYDAAAEYSLTPLVYEISSPPQLRRIKQPLMRDQKMEEMKGVQEKLTKFKDWIFEGNIFEIVRNLYKSSGFLVNPAAVTPSLLHMGCRKNCFHFAVEADLPRVIRYVVDILTDRRWVATNFHHAKDITEFSNRILDMYANISDKYANETSVHIACKFGNYDCLAELMFADVIVDKNTKNYLGYTVEEIVCNRLDDTDSDKIFIKEAILKLLNAQKCRLCLMCCHGHYYFEKIVKVSHEKSLPYIDSSSQNEIVAYMDFLFVADMISTWEKWKKYVRHVVRKEEFSKHHDLIISYGRSLSNSITIHWKEYISFLEGFYDIRCLFGMKRFEEFLHGVKMRLEIEQNSQIPMSLIADFCSLTLKDASPNSGSVRGNDEGVDEDENSKKPESLACFIYGENTPTHHDFFMHEALVDQEILPDVFPYVHSWFTNMSSIISSVKS